VTKEKLKALKEATETILLGAKTEKEKFSACAINWGDLKCIDVESVHSLKNTEVEDRVYIEEADPGAKSFADHVSNLLYQGGYGDVEVHLAW
jgi:hypothetical protein